jgi:hypothetical protein
MTIYTFPSNNDTLTSGSPLSGQDNAIPPGGDDYWQFVVPQTETLYFTLNSSVSDSGFPNIGLYDSSFNAINYFQGMTLAAGTYYFSVSNSDASSESYALTLSTTATPAPVVTANDQTVADGQQVPLTSLFSVGGSGITEYQVWFGDPEDGSPALGTVTRRNGNPLAQDRWVTVGSLNGLTYTGSATAGTDKIWVTAYNGTWSSVTEADITDPGLSPPVVTANNETVTYGQQVPLTNLFSVSSSGITEYQVWFGDPEDGSPALGSVTNNGAPIPQDQWVTLSSLSGLEYTGSVTAGTDKIWVRAYNGVWSGVAEADITDPGVTPAVVTAHNRAVTDGKHVALKNLFSVSGSGITEYQVWFGDPEDGWPALGTVTHNGNPIAHDQWVTLNSLNGLQYTGSATAGTDKIWVRAYDGVWSNVSEVDITDPGNTVDPFIPSTDATPNHPTAADVVATAKQYVGALWTSDNSEGLVWAVSEAIGAPFYETVHTVAANAGETVKQALTVVPDNGYVVPPAPPEAGASSDWVTLPVTNDWQSVVQPGDVVRIPAKDQAGNTILADSPHGFSFIVVGQNDLGQWLVIDTTNPHHQSGSGGGGAKPIAIKEHTFDTVNPLYSEVLNADTAYVSRLTTDETITAGTTVEIKSAYTGNVTFASSTGTLQLDRSRSFSGTVAGMSGQDTLDLRDVSFATVQTPTFSGTSSGGTLTVTDGTHTANIALLGNYLASTFVASSDGHGGTDIVDPALASSGQQGTLAQPHHG